MCSDNNGKPNPLLFERWHWQHVGSHVHFIVKQHWQHIDIHPLLIKCAMSTHGKQDLLSFEREQWQYVENHTHCLVKQQLQHIKIHPLLIKYPVTTQGKQTTSIVLWKRAVTTNEKSHPLHGETAVTTYRNPSTAY